MEEPSPEFPQPLPEVPRKALWLTLGLPPGITSLLGCALASNSDLRTGAGAGLLLLTPLLIFAGLIHGATIFSTLVGKRYRGPSLIFLVLSYLLGQIIVCLTLWIGTCLLVPFLYNY